MPRRLRGGGAARPAARSGKGEAPRRGSCARYSARLPPRGEEVSAPLGRDGGRPRVLSPGRRGGDDEQAKARVKEFAVHAPPMTHAGAPVEPRTGLTKALARNGTAGRRILVEIRPQPALGFLGSASRAARHNLRAGRGRCGRRRNTGCRDGRNRSRRRPRSAASRSFRSASTPAGSPPSMSNRIGFRLWSGQAG